MSQPHGSHSSKITLMTLFTIEHVCVNARARQSSKNVSSPNPHKVCTPPLIMVGANCKWISPHPLKGMFILEPPHPQCVTLHKHHEARTTQHVFDPPTQSICTLPMLKTMSVNSIAQCSKVLGHLVCETLFLWCEVVGVIHGVVKRVEGKKLLWECG